MHESPPTPSRIVHKADARRWLEENPAPRHSSVITSLPDYSELRELGFEGWCTWFVEAVCQLIGWVPPDGLAVFYQSDIRHEGAWVDKSWLLGAAITKQGARLVWHKIVCRKPPGSIAFNRPSYSHMLCVSRGVMPSLRHPGPDVLPDAGAMDWSRAMGETACRVACQFLRLDTQTRTIVDPYCGRGTVLRVANSFGFDALGIDRSPKRCRAARR